MINNNYCESCRKAAVCRNRDILAKFDKDAKKQLGIDITMDNCDNFEDAFSEAITGDYQEITD